MFWALDYLNALNRGWTLCKRWVTKSWPLKKSDCHPKNLFLSLKSVMQRLGPIEKRKRNCSEWVECFGHWTVLMCWTEGGLCTRDGWLKAGPQRSQFHPTNLFLSLNLWCKDLVPQKRGKGNVLSASNVLATGLSFYAEQREDFVQEMVN